LFDDRTVQDTIFLVEPYGKVACRQTGEADTAGIPALPELHRNLPGQLVIGIDLCSFTDRELAAGLYWIKYCQYCKEYEVLHYFFHPVTVFPFHTAKVMANYCNRKDGLAYGKIN